jgi:large subunit ribosomal protein L10
MTREEKVNIITELKSKFESNAHFYIADASGLTVAQVNDFRSNCFKEGVEYRVVKNTLIKRALNEIEGDFSELDSILNGFSGILFSKESGNAPARIIREFRKKGNDKPLLKAASVENELYLGDESLDALSALKSKNEIIGEIIMLLQSPVQNVMSALGSGKSTLAGIVKTLSEKENNKN